MEIYILKEEKDGYLTSKVGQDGDLYLKENIDGHLYLKIRQGWISIYQ